MDKTLSKITQEIAEELDIPKADIVKLINQQQADILEAAKNRKIDFIFLKYFGTFSVRANYRRPFRNDKYTHGK